MAKGQPLVWAVLAGCGRGDDQGSAIHEEARCHSVYQFDQPLLLFKCRLHCPLNKICFDVRRGLNLVNLPCECVVDAIAVRIKLPDLGSWFRTSALSSIGHPEHHRD
jgi:hypothetical protein